MIFSFSKEFQRREEKESNVKLDPFEEKNHSSRDMSEEKTLEEKLATFRRKKAKENFQKKVSNLFNGMKRFFFGKRYLGMNEESPPPTEEEEEEKRPTNWLIIAFKCFLWFISYAIFIYFQFGAIYFICSLLYLIYSNLGVGTGRRKNQLSAYSVFNPRFEKLQGTFSAEDYDRQLRHGSIYSSSSHHHHD